MSPKGLSLIQEQAKKKADYPFSRFLLLEKDEKGKRNGTDRKLSISWQWINVLVETIFARTSVYLLSLTARLKAWFSG